MFKIVWDREHNGVRLTQSPRGEALNISPRPVFWEELDFLHLAEQHGWQYPHCQEPLLWACERRYFYRGEVVLEVHGGNIFDAPNVEPRVEGLRLEPVSIERLREVNEDAMFIIEHEAMNFIADTYRRYSGIAATTAKNPDIDFQQLAERQTKRSKQEHVVVREDCDSFDIMPLSEAERQGKRPVLSGKVEMFVASFSGGKDSQVVLDLCTRALPPEAFLVIYSDTGYELPTSLVLYDQVQQHYHALFPTLQFHTARNHQPVLYYWDQMGSPSRIHRWCCTVMKSAPLSRKLKEIAGTDRQPQAVLFDGVRAEESEARSGRSKIGKNVKHNNIINVSPILEWNSTEIYLYLFLNSLPINQSYRQGLSRVGCVVCPYSSGWSEDLCGQLYPETIVPFTEHITCSLKRAKVSGIDNYIKLGKWKTRAGGRDINAKSNIQFVNDSPVFQATLSSPGEAVCVWLKTLGQLNTSEIDGGVCGNLVRRGQCYRFRYRLENAGTWSFELKEVDPADVIFIGLLKRALYKATFCVHCEVCEVECPTGALKVTPTVSIDETKCVHCNRCLQFHDRGCIAAASITTANVNMLNNKQNMIEKKSGINRYNDGMGLRQVWLERYFDSYETFFDNDQHGLNPKYQLPPFINWIREAGILNLDNKGISETGLLLSKHYGSAPLRVWEIIFINLCYNSEICSWFYANIDHNRTYTREELDVILQESFPELMDRTLRNPFNSLLNTFKESPLGGTLKVCVTSREGRTVTYHRQPYNDLSLVGVAYSLYRYAEKVGRKDLTVGELYNEQQKEGIVRQFGIERDVLERKLRSLQEEQNRVLSVELNMGLDNINLRQDLSAMDVLRMLI